MLTCSTATKRMSEQGQGRRADGGTRDPVKSLTAWTTVGWQPKHQTSHPYTSNSNPCTFLQDRGEPQLHAHSSWPLAHSSRCQLLMSLRAHVHEMAKEGSSFFWCPSGPYCAAHASTLGTPPAHIRLRSQRPRDRQLC